MYGRLESVIRPRIRMYQLKLKLCKLVVMYRLQTAHCDTTTTTITEISELQNFNLNSSMHEFESSMIISL